MFCNHCNSFEKLLQRLAQTISWKYSILLFPLNLIITIIVILLAYSTVCIAWGRGSVTQATVCSDLIIILHQARGLLPMKKLNRTGISNLNWLFIKEMKSSGATLGLWNVFQARSYIYMKGKPFLSKTLCKIVKVLILGQSFLI